MVLTIEASASLRKLLSTEIEDMGLATITASNGDDALKLLDTFEVDMVIANLLMLEMSGFELASQIRRKTDYISVPIIMMTSIPIRLLRIDKANGHIDEWIEKPVSPGQIRETIQKYFETPKGKNTINIFAAGGK
jgi:DNA-binding response OmpR family regulator